MTYEAPKTFPCLHRPPDVYAGPYVLPGTKASWLTFAHWHFRGRKLGPVSKILVLHGEIYPIGICVLGYGPLVCRPRNQTFGIRAQLTRRHALWINLSFTRALRLVIHPRFRHIGLGPALLRTAAESAPTPWVELVSQHPAVATWAIAAGFLPGVTDQSSSSQNHPYRQSRTSAPLREAYFRPGGYRHLYYFTFDNRANVHRHDAPARLEVAATCEE